MALTRGGVSNSEGEQRGWRFRCGIWETIVPDKAGGLNSRLQVREDDEQDIEHDDADDDRFYTDYEDYLSRYDAQPLILKSQGWNT